MFLYSLISAHISCYYSNNKCEELLPYPVKKYLNRKISYQYLVRLECYKLIKHLLDEKKYQAFQMWW